ncbi:hypothetical protein [Streptomyces africanus]|uniref:hypothetical protein n=1 Tax=Streptomyces africanus TaxID=231024 RepID=UPI000A3C005A|nr:hypothetical protein [Streptomyces africanus]
MSTSDEQYRVLYFKDGEDAFTEPESLDDARATAQRLGSEGYDVSAVMGDVAAQGYMHARQNGPEGSDPFGPGPDLMMSRETADLLLRAVTGLLDEGYWPKAYTGYGPDDTDEKDYDTALVRRAADIVGRDRIKNRGLLEHLAELDAEVDG